MKPRRIADETQWTRSLNVWMRLSLAMTVGSWSYSRHALSKPCIDIESGWHCCLDKDD